MMLYPRAQYSARRAGCGSDARAGLRLAPQRQGDGDGGALAFAAGDGDVAAVLTHDLPGLGEAAAAVGRPISRIAGAEETLDYVWQISLWDADAVVDHAQQGARLTAGIDAADRDQRRAAGGAVLERIGQQMAK